ncbi:ANK3 [Symbiodinium necroappetens]|uniref:ANK3 protein n=1 Tax=Symbiodinium necroappetens TaxID=1628268 RepID=A0A812W9A2_9DINO|nr:ANK3 [Symbiodinium necroappetens]
MDQQKQVVKWLMLSNDQLLAVVEEQRALIEHLRWETRPSGPRMAPLSLGDISESQEALKDCSKTWTSTLQQREDALQPVAFAASQGQQASSPEGAPAMCCIWPPSAPRYVLRKVGPWRSYPQSR